MVTNTKDVLKLTVAIDGPAGAGKSTVAQIIAQRLEYIYIDTGAMYRAVTLRAIEAGIFNADAFTQIAQDIKIGLEFIKGKTYVSIDGSDVTEAIRTPSVSNFVAQVAQVPGVRNAMLEAQRKMAALGGIVMDGRDIGTFVLPNAKVKVFLTASIEARALRRFEELTQKGFSIQLAELTEEIKLRDKTDSEREIAPLVKADDAVLIDTTGLSIEEVVTKILALCKERA